MNKISLLSYRMKVRKELLKLPREMVEATLDECKKVLGVKKK